MLALLPQQLDAKFSQSPTQYDEYSYYGELLNIQQ